MKKTKYDWENMSHPGITAALGLMLIKDVFHYPDPRIYWANEVTYDYTLAHPIRVDFMRFKPRNTLPSGLEQSEFLAYEVKSCKQDFESGHGLNFIADLNYVVVPPTLVGYAREHNPFGVGIYTPVTEYGRGEVLKCVKPSRRFPRERPALELLFGLTRSLGREHIKGLKDSMDVEPAMEQKELEI
ncbi:hypothetical protein MCC01966_12860 [Bifidobacteriaceae bacterium MCC01966]|nr:hypothetical protein MCC01966_12860 [Bifidobacteriaceae bacterium MCC01966]